MPICAYCGKGVDNPTRDHVPPRGIFGSKPDYNLITVPSCGACNWGTSKDDELFKLLAVEEEASETPAAQHVIESTVKAMSRTDRPKFGEMVRGKMRFGDVYTEGGIYLGKRHTINLDYSRILNTVEKIVRGLFFHINGRPLPGDYRVWCHLIPQARKLFTGEALTELEELLVELGTKMTVNVGPRVFRYKYGVSAEDENTAYFMLGFYDRFDFVGYTYPLRVGQEETSPTLAE